MHTTIRFTITWVLQCVCLASSGASVLAIAMTMPTFSKVRGKKIHIFI